MSSEDKSKVIGYADDRSVHAEHKSVETLASEMKAAAKRQMKAAILGPFGTGKGLYVAPARPEDVLTILASHTAQAEEIERLRSVGQVSTSATGLGLYPIPAEWAHVGISSEGVHVQGSPESIETVARWWGDSKGLKRAEARATSAESKIVESEAREGALREALERIGCIMPGDLHDNVTTARNRLNAAIEIATAALTLKGRI